MAGNKKQIKEQYCAYIEEIDDFYPFPKEIDCKNTMPIFTPGKWPAYDQANRTGNITLEIIPIREVHERREINKIINELNNRADNLENELEHFNSRTIAEPYKTRLSIITNLITELKKIQSEYDNMDIWGGVHNEIKKAELIKSDIEALISNTDTNTPAEPEPAVKKKNEKFNSAIFNQPYFIIKEKEIFVKIIEQLNGHKIIFADFENPITLKTNGRDLTTPLFGLLKAMENKKIITGLQSTTAKNIGEDVIKFFNYYTEKKGTDNYKIKQFADGHTTYISNPKNHENKTFQKSVVEFENLIDEAIEKKN